MAHQGRGCAVHGGFDACRRYWAVATYYHIDKCRRPGAIGIEISEISEKDVPGPFPISGKDVVALGVKRGPEIGAILSAVEKLWIESNFPEEARVREILAELISTRR